MGIVDDTIAVVLAGGAGKRLAPLTNERAKPAVPFGGKYRIIDFTLTNCLRSNLRRILVLTQYKSHSLQKHLRDGWSIFNAELSEYITPVPAQMRTGDDWYKGTADALYQNLFLLERSGAKTILILSADHIYRMDYAEMIKFHKKSGADATIASMAVDINTASEFGVMNIDNTMLVTGFNEKPSQPQPSPTDATKAIVSIGIYIFEIDQLIEALQDDNCQKTSSHDFGHDIIPHLIDSKKVYAYPFGKSKGRVTADHYWRDVGTIDAYYAANMDMLRPVPSLDLYQVDWPIRSYQHQTPPARTVQGMLGDEGIIINSILAGGTVISGASVQHSVLFSHVYVGDRALVRDAIIFDRVRIGQGARVMNCIIDKDVFVPDGETIGVDAVLDRERFSISEKGVVIVPRGYQFG